MWTCTAGAQEEKHKMHRPWVLSCPFQHCYTKEFKSIKSLEDICFKNLRKEQSILKCFATSRTNKNCNGWSLQRRLQQQLKGEGKDHTDKQVRVKFTFTQNKSFKEGVKSCVKCLHTDKVGLGLRNDMSSWLCINLPVTTDCFRST